MNRFWYSILLYFLSPLLLIYLAIRAFKSADYRGRWAERFGLTKLTATPLLFHTASMGETLAAIPLIKSIMERHPQLAITITTTSPTGSAEVIKAFGDKVQHCYLPFDLSFSVKRFLNQVKPQCCVILETELWPNLLHFCYRKSIDIVLANARLSEKSALKYQQWPQLIKPMLNQLSQVSVQTEVERKRFIELGLPAEKLHVFGSLKYDISISSGVINEGLRLRANWERKNHPVWVAGSVHPTEFDSIILAHRSLLKHYPEALLIMVPRHPEQFNVAADKIKVAELTMARRSLGQSVNLSTQVLLGDTMGELRQFYAIADQAFIGGSFNQTGGQNPLEPAAVGLALMMGNSFENFEDICQQLIKVEALTIVEDGDALAQALRSNIDSQQQMQHKQQAAKQLIEENRGSVQRQVALLEKLL
ncbi:MAG: lipid IV(A) 3-deoxy-D-manno-octulosonic acid transferase [Parashewanella sp.]